MVWRKEGREDRKSLRHMYVTLKYGDGVCAANSIRQDFQCGHDELIWGIRHHFPLPLPAHCSLRWNLAWGLPIADGDVALPCLGATRLFFGGWETRRATAVIDSRVLFGTDSLVWYAGRLCNMQLRQKELGGGCGRLLFGWRWFWVLMMSLTLLLRLFDN